MLREGIELVLSADAVAARHEGGDYVLETDDGRELRGERLLVATGRRPRVLRLGLRPSASIQTRMGFRSTSTCVPPRTCGRSAT
ncbi:MAG TPA: hypothetical protein VK790_05030 [Solirubrobacteraceae bacterium]|nr:hypothetical protein [Solirubrobacteraceae bacterium]